MRLVLCAVLALLSPGGECYAASAVLFRGRVVRSGSAFAPVIGQSRVSSFKIFPVVLSLSPANLSKTLQAASSVSPAAAGGKIAPAAESAVIAAAVFPAEAGVSEAAQPAAGLAQEVLAQGARQIAQARDPAARELALNKLFAGDRAKTDGGAAEIRNDGVWDGFSRIHLEPASREDAAAAVVDPPVAFLSELAGKAKVFITRAGAAPVTVALAALGPALASDPAVKEALNKFGRIRVVLSNANPAGGLTKAEVGELQRALSGYGITAKIDVENIAIDWGKKAPESDSSSSSDPDSAVTRQKAPSEESWLWRRIVGPITWPFRQISYLARTFGAAYTSPDWKETVGGLVSKTPQTVLSIIAWKVFFAGHPAAFAATMIVSFAVNIFHGVWTNTWNNFQNALGKQRGLKYQSIFNLLYGQSLGVVFRSISWSANPKVVPPWSYKYWKDMGIQTIVGTFFGTLGFQGVNALYDKGRLSRWQRSALQQVRDFLICMVGVFFNSGSMLICWTTFIVQQSLDALIYYLSRQAKQRPILYIADELVAATPEFQAMYPAVGPASLNQESPLKQAWRGLLESPFAKPVVWLVKKIGSLLKKKIRSQRA